MNHHSFNGKLMRHPVPLPSKSLVHLAMTHCCAPSKHYVRGPCNRSVSCHGSLISHLGGNRLVRTSDVRFPSSLGCRAGRLTHAMCNNNNVVPSCFIPLSALACAGCRHRLATGNTVMGAGLTIVSHCHGRCRGHCPGFGTCGGRFRISSGVLTVLHTRTSGTNIGRSGRLCRTSLPCVGIRLGTLVTHSL